MPNNKATIGFKARTGRAIAVVLSGPANAPQLISRSEMILHDPRTPGTFQPFHEVMDLPWEQSQQKVRPFVRAIEKIVTRNLAQLVHELRAQGLTVAGVGVAGSADRDLARIGNYHIRAHAAEGILFRRVIESAAEANQLAYRTFAEKTLLSEAAKERGVTAAQLNKQLKSLGESSGPPWRAEHRTAAVAAWLMLGGK